MLAVSRVIQALQVQQELQARKVKKAKREIKATKVSKAYRAKKATRVTGVNRESKAKRAQTVLLPISKTARGG